MGLESDADLERQPDVRVGAYLRNFGRTPDGWSFGWMALLFCSSYLYKEGADQFLIVIGSCYAIGLPGSYLYWRLRSLRDADYAKRYAAQSGVSWGSWAAVMLFCGAAVAATPGYWRLLCIALIIVALAIVVRLIQGAPGG